MKRIFDLTTTDSLNTALAVLESDLGWVLFPTAKLAKALVEYLRSTSEVSPEKQTEAAERIIAAGRLHNAKRVRLKVSKTVGVKLKANIEGADVSTTLGTDGAMELDVEYK